MNGLAKAATANDVLLVFFLLVQIVTDKTVQLPLGALHHDPKLPAQGAGIGLVKIPNSDYALLCELGADATSYPPHLTNRFACHGFHLALGPQITPHQHAIEGLGVFFGQVVAEFGQGFGWAYAHTGGDAYPLHHPVTDLMAHAMQIFYAAEI